MIQTRWLAQGDAEEWMNILFIVAVAVFWAIGGLIKAAGAKKNAPQKGGQAPRRRQPTWQERLARKAEEMMQAAEGRVRASQQQGEPSHQEDASSADRPKQGRVIMRARRGGEPVLVYERHDVSQPPQRRSPRPVREHRRHREDVSRRRPRPIEPESPVTSATDRPGPEISSPSPPIQSRPQPVSEPVASPYLIDYADIDALKRAILHYEILGKPVSLRDPSQQVADF